jgi:regulatory protein
MRANLTVTSPIPEEPEQLELADSGAINPLDIRLAAMDLLARREHLVQELQLKLHRRFADSGAISDALQRLREEGLQSDERFCESYVQQRSGRGYGPERMRMELRKKGAAAELAEIALAACEVDWLALARSTRHAKFGEAIPTDFKEKSRQLRFLQYRGFAGDTVARVLHIDDD